MTKYQVSKAIFAEIIKLNQAIDRKIIAGISYREESRRHKSLLAKLRYLAGERPWYARGMNFIATLVL